ncbi:MAG TPA: VWA domain-containing protein [Planctomycetaceae bacterium]|nr:VWA domain-containing protein [Planctomycetaceae bacterium]
MQWLNTLAWWQWLILAMVPPAIIALYFLKLKRRPLEVPSTYLWHKSIEDLHVNTIWQRLRRNLLLFLQLLLVFLAMLALLRPGWQTARLVGDRFIFLVDHSASMQATDASSSRLEEAKRRVRQLIEQMDSGDVAMVVSFADQARVAQMFTDNRAALLRSLESIGPTARSTSIQEALQVASGLANPGRSAYDETDVQVAEPLPATVFITSDGQFPPLPDFDLGNLTPKYLPVGSPTARNVGIVMFSLRRHELRPAELEAFARVENFGPADARVDCQLRLDGQLVDADRFTIPAGESESVVFPLGEVEPAVAQLVISVEDHFALDNEAWAIVDAPRRAKVLVVTPGNRPLQYALSTQAAAKMADVQMVEPGFLATESYRTQAALGTYDLVIYDRCQPKEPPQANTLFIAASPPGPRWKTGPQVNMPEIIDVDTSHALMQWLSLGDVLIDTATPLEVPPGGSVLIDSHVGPLLVIAPREGFEDAVLAFPLIYQRQEDGRAATYFGTNWPFRASFPVFVINLLEYLGGARRGLGGESLRAGQSIELTGPAPGLPLEVRTPSGDRIVLDEPHAGKYRFTGTTELGVYEVYCQGKRVQRLAVNLFDRAESNIVPKDEIHLPVAVAAAPGGWESVRRELWKWLLLLALGVLCFEWYIYNRRVFL